MATIEDFIGWLRADFARFASFDDHAEVVSLSAANGAPRLVLQLYTEKSRYRIVASERLSAPIDPDGYGYLGAQVSARAPRAGEEHTRGRDLADGSLTRETWIRILADIVACELVRVTGPNVLRVRMGKPPIASHAEALTAVGIAACAGPATEPAFLLHQGGGGSVRCCGA